MHKLTALAVIGLLTTSCSSGANAPSVLPAQPGVTDLTQSAATISQITGFAGYGNGSAYAATALLQAGSTAVLSGPVAPASLGCDVTNNSAQNSALDLNAAPYYVSSGTAKDVVTSTHSVSSGGMESTSTVQGVSLLHGMIKATAVKAEANSTATFTAAASNENGSELAGLSVAGVPISALPAQNTKVALPGIGYVVLNEVSGPATGTSTTSIDVRMIHVYVTTANTLGMNVGTQIIVGHAQSAFARTAAPYVPAATAYSLLVRGVAGDIHASSGPWSIASVDCTSGSDTNRLAEASTAAGSVGSMVNAVSNTNASGSTTAAAGSNTTSATLLRGLISAQAIVTRASASRSGATFARSGTTTFTALKVAGTSFASSVPPNTRVNLAGIGYAVLNAQAGYTTTSSSYEEVNGIEVFVTTANSLNLPVGAQIIVAHAHTQVSGY